MKLKFWIGIVISVLCLYFVFRNIEFQAFKLTTHALENLRGEGVPATVLENLIVLENQEFANEHELLDGVEKQIGPEQTLKYKEPILQQAGFNKVFETLRSTNYLYLAIAVLLNLSTIWLRAERWKYLLAPIKQLTFRHLVPATMIGFMANNILPARAGEFIRAYVIAKKEQISKTTSFATIVIERICDMTTIILFLLIVLVVVKFPQSANPGHLAFISPSLMTKVGGLSAAFVLGLLFFLVMLKEFPQKTTNLVRKVLTPLPTSLTHKLLELLDSFRLGLQVLKTGRHLFFLVIWSVSVWVAASISAWFVFRAFGLQIPLMAGFFVTVLIAFSVALPSSPGYIGLFHAAVFAGVLFFLPDFDESTAAGIAIVFHLVTIIPITLMGLFYLWKENLSFAEIQHIKEEDEEERSEISADD